MSIVFLAYYILLCKIVMWDLVGFSHLISWPEDITLQQSHKMWPLSLCVCMSKRRQKCIYVVYHPTLCLSILIHACQNNFDEIFSAVHKIDWKRVQFSSLFFNEKYRIQSERLVQFVILAFSHCWHLLHLINKFDVWTLQEM